MTAAISPVRWRYRGTLKPAKLDTGCRRGKGVRAVEKVTREAVLRYHTEGRKGKIEVVPSKPSLTQYDLSLAYSPGVAIPVREIADDPELAYEYTTKGNLVGVISNGTAILGLGNLGPLASKPVMEGKGLLFKRFADIDVFDIEINAFEPDDVVRIVQALAPTFGGINLEDIKAPECFAIEETLRERLDIPVFHDDQHGTAIIVVAGLFNALDLTGRKIHNLKVVFSGAGAAGIGCASLLVEAGVPREHITLCDKDGVVYKGRTENMNAYLERFAQETDARTLAEAIVGADLFVGVSVGGILTQDMVRSMSERPIIFAMANPDPEITYEEAKAAAPNAIVATGRSDYPNQVNNVLCFPFIFRGALDVRARQITDGMKLAAARALADLAHEDVPDSVLKAYGQESLLFGPDYIIPKPVDPRVLLYVTPAVAQAAISEGVARKRIGMTSYREELESRLGKDWALMRTIFNKARTAPKKIVFAEGEEAKIIRAAAEIHAQDLGEPILLGSESVIQKTIAELGLEYQPKVIDPRRSQRSETYAKALFQRRQRKGVTLPEAREMSRRPNYFGLLMVQSGDADAFISGLTTNYVEALQPAFQVIGTRTEVRRAAALFIMIIRDRVFFFADCAVTITPSAEDLADIAEMAAEVATNFDIQNVRIAMLSFSNFGSVDHPSPKTVAGAVEILKKRQPLLQVDGEMAADVAVMPELIERLYGFSRVREANVLIFPDLNAANTSYKLMQRLGGAEAIGPVLMGMNRAVHILLPSHDVRDIVNMAAIAAVDAQMRFLA
ncbi:MAG: NADP-dependent malic enzyme [Rhodospirillales bacterium]|nr:NADP-dependent malic enzyme [Rhodospirillales bacterium]